MFIYSHNENSEGAKELARALHIRRIKHEKSAFIGGPKKTVINWGSHEIPEQVKACKVLNPPNLITLNANKLNFFQSMKGAKEPPRTPRWTTDPEEAKKWVAEEKTVVARKLLNASSGAGIHFMEFDRPNSFVNAPLYTEYVKKKDEYRVHFMHGEIIDFQRKALREGVHKDDVDWRIRNLDNGFVFVRGNVTLPEDVTRQANLAIAASTLDFGAIDLIYNHKESKAYVLEINTAPGLQGETVTTYAEAFKRFYA